MKATIAFALLALSAIVMLGITFADKGTSNPDITLGTKRPTI